MLGYKAYAAQTAGFCGAYEGILVEFVTTGTTGTIATDGLVGSWPFWHASSEFFGTNYGCGGGQVAVPTSVRSDFFDYVFPFVTSDTSAAQPCSETLLLPPTGTRLCTLFVARYSMLSGRDTLILDNNRCSARVIFGCRNGVCITLPATSGEIPCE